VEEIMDYAALLKRTWEITWKHKILWVFGLFASCSGQSYQFNASGPSRSIQYEFGPGELPQMERFFEQYGEELLVGVSVLFLCMCLLLLISWVLGALAQGGLVAGFSMAQEGQQVDFRSVWDQATNFFWRILVINLIPLGLGLLAIVLIVISFGLCALPLICLAIPIALVVSVFVKLSTNAVVVEDLTVGEAIEKAWLIMQTQLGELVVVGLLLIVAGVLASLLIGAPFLLTAAPLIVGWATGQQETVRTGATFLIVCGVLYIPVMIAFNAVLSTFTNGAWTLAYRRWAGKDTGV
jgi:hypothetical protein